MGGLLIVLSFLLMLEVLTFNTHLSLLVKTMEKSALPLCFLMLSALCIIVGYAVAGHLVFSGAPPVPLGMGQAKALGSHRRRTAVDPLQMPTFESEFPPHQPHAPRCLPTRPVGGLRYAGNNHQFPVPASLLHRGLWPYLLPITCPTHIPVQG